MIYYKPVANKDEELEEKILQIWLDHNNKGWRTIKADLAEYHQQIVNHKRVRRIMKHLGIRGILPRPINKLSAPRTKGYVVKHSFSRG